MAQEHKQQPYFIFGSAVAIGAEYSTAWKAFEAQTKNPCFTNFCWNTYNCYHLKNAVSDDVPMFVGENWLVTINFQWQSFKVVWLKRNRGLVRERHPAYIQEMIDAAAQKHNFEQSK